MKLREGIRAEARKDIRLGQGGDVGQVEYLGVVLEGRHGGALGGGKVQGRLG